MAGERTPQEEVAIEARPSAEEVLVDKGIEGVSETEESLLPLRFGQAPGGSPRRGIDVHHVNAPLILVT